MTTLQMNAQIQKGLRILQDDEGMMRQVVQLVQKLVKQHQKEDNIDVANHPLAEFRGMFKGIAKTDRELIDEYLEDKYGV